VTLTILAMWIFYVMHITERIVTGFLLELEEHLLRFDLEQKIKLRITIGDIG
jgi:hypothetical protein